MARSPGRRRCRLRTGIRSDRLTVTDGRHKLLTAHRDDTVYTELLMAVDSHEIDDLTGRSDYAAVECELQAAAISALVPTALL